MECLIEERPCSCTEAELLQGVFPEGCHNSLCCLCTLSQHPLNGERASRKDGRKNFSKVLRCGVHMGFLFFPLMSKTMFRIEQEKILRSCSFSMNPLLRKNTKISKLFIFCSSAEKRSTTQNLSEKVLERKEKNQKNWFLFSDTFQGQGIFMCRNSFLSAFSVISIPDGCIHLCCTEDLCDPSLRFAPALNQEGIEGSCLHLTLN